MKKQNVGGQAVIEGVMMQSKNYRAIAVRKSNGEIELKKERIKSWVQDKKIDKIPFLRGAFVLFETMIEGMKSLNYSSEFFMEDDEEEEDAIDRFLKKIFKDKANDAIMAVSMVLAMLISVFFFVLIPTSVVGAFSWLIKNNIVLNLMEGLLRITILILYMLGISKLEDIKRTFMYHGAEHKCINCIEHGLELNVENVRKSSKQHKRCGTSFLLIVMLVSILCFMFIDVDSKILRLAIRFILIPFIAGVSFEFIRLAGKCDNWFVNMISKPGLWMQKLTTKEPDDTMIEVGIASVEAVFDWRAWQKEAK